MSDADRPTRPGDLVVLRGGRIDVPLWQSDDPSDDSIAPGGYLAESSLMLVVAVNVRYVFVVTDRSVGYVGHVNVTRVP